VPSLRNLRLITRRDTTLVVALIAGTLIAFERPFRWLLDFTHDLELRYHIDLMPALTLLVVAFVFHLHDKRRQAKAEMLAIASEMAQTRARQEELERLMALGQTLANALDRRSLEQVLWHGLSSFVGERPCCVLVRRGAGWDLLMRDEAMLRRHSIESLEALVTRTVSAGFDADAAREGVALGSEDLAVPMIAGGVVVGVIVVGNAPRFDAQERVALGAAAALVAIAARNANLLHDARESGSRDPLTGCFTRAHTLEVLRAELRRARRSQRPLSLLMFDVDGFKAINDRSGHLGGDAVLASIGAHLNGVLRATDVRCRYGGDEFLVVLPDTPILGAQQVAEGLRREIADRSRDEQGMPTLTISLGVATTLPGEMDPMALIARADDALYRAKRAGRNRYCVGTVQELPAPVTVAG
jgi:diguanylate cyclase (GGDEF)-like protein